MTNAEERCKSCVHWHSKATVIAQRGECRRFPPLVDGWPPSKADDWCGEFKARPVEDDDEEEETSA